MKKRLFSSIAACVAAAMLFTGCFGSFGATRWLYNWNDSFGNKFVKTLIMWLFIIIPAYELFMFADFWIINTIEFWTGSNPIGNAEPTYDVEEDGTMIVRFNEDSLRFIPVDDNRLMVEHNGAIVGEASKTGERTLLLTNFASAETKTLELPATL